MNDVIERPIVLAGISLVWVVGGAQAQIVALAPPSGPTPMSTVAAAISDDGSTITGWVKYSEDLTVGARWTIGGDQPILFAFPEISECGPGVPTNPVFVNSRGEFVIWHRGRSGFTGVCGCINGDQPGCSRLFMWNQLDPPQRFSGFGTNQGTCFHSASDNVIFARIYECYNCFRTMFDAWRPSSQSRSRVGEGLCGGNHNRFIPTGASHDGHVIVGGGEWLAGNTLASPGEARAGRESRRFFDNLANSLGRLFTVTADGAVICGSQLSSSQPFYLENRRRFTFSSEPVYGTVSQRGGFIWGTQIWDRRNGPRSYEQALADVGVDVGGWSSIQVTEMTPDELTWLGTGRFGGGAPVPIVIMLPRPVAPSWTPIAVSADKSSASLRVSHAESGALLRQIPLPDVSYPNGVMVTLPNEAVVADVFGHRVLRIDLISGNVIQTYAGGGLATPVDVVYTQSDTLLISDFSAGAVREFDAATGAFIRNVFAPGAQGVDGAAGIDARYVGQIMYYFGDVPRYYVCSQNNDRVYSFTLQPNNVPQIVAQGCGLDAPGDVLDLGGGNGAELLVSSFNTDEIIRFRNGVCEPCVAAGTAGLDGPEGLFITGTTRFAVTSRWNGKLLEFDLNTCAFLRELTGLAGEPTYFSYGHVDADDCDENGSPDAWDIAEGRLLDSDQNGVPDVCEGVVLLGDVDCDGFVTVGDIGGFVLALTDPAGYASTYPSCDMQRADVNQDGVVTVGDIGAFVQLLTGP